MAGNPPKLTRLDRLFLSNQMRILEVLYPDDADGIATRREAIERGYEMLYEWDMDHIYDGEDVMTSEESLEVWDTLDMFDSLKQFFSANNDSEFSKHGFAKFRGYDGNNEAKFMAFTAYTIERLKRFQRVLGDRNGYWNSHMPVRSIYRRMLEEWKRIPPERRFQLTEGEVKIILDATVHPSNR